MTEWGKHMSFNPGGGAISGATDVALSNPTGGHLFTYDTSIGKWKNLDASEVNDIGVATQKTVTTSYTLILGDTGTVVEVNAASAVNVTVPPNSSVVFPVGAMVQLRQYGAGQITVVAGSGVTIRSRDGDLKLTGQYSEAVLTKRATNEWILSGDLTT
jgi:3D (Asp-Asp-Asp) domain-containing protein